MIKLTNTENKLRDSLFFSVSVGRAYELLRVTELEHLKKATKELGFKYCRFHGLFHDEMGVVVRKKDGNIAYQWHMIDKLFDNLKEIGIRPFVELGAMPIAMASGDETVFDWNMNITKPKDYKEWYELVRSFVSHMVDRYGLDEINEWYFEVWNEPNLVGFWPHGMSEYWQLYENAAKAVKSVSSTLKVGGPATAGGQYIPEMISYCVSNSVPIDFVSTHIYPIGEYCEYYERENSPYELGKYMQGRMFEVQEQVKNSALPNLEIHWTEWNTQSGNTSKNITWIENPTLDMHFGASCVAHNLITTMSLYDSVAYWTVSDLIEEASLPHSPFSCSYGMLTIHGIKKATYNAYMLLRKLRGYKMEIKYENTPPLACGLTATSENNVVRLVAYNNNLLEINDQPDFRETISIPCAEIGVYVVTKAVIKKYKGSAYDTWLDMGSPQNLSKIQQELLEAHSEMEYSFNILSTDDERNIHLDFELKPNEVMYVEIEIQGQSYLSRVPSKDILEKRNNALMIEEK